MVGEYQLTFVRFSTICCFLNLHALLTRRIEARQTALNILPSGNAGLVDEQVKPGLIIC
jgi:hypothetical protein